MRARGRPSLAQKGQGRRSWGPRGPQGLSSSLFTLGINTKRENSLHIVKTEFKRTVFTLNRATHLQNDTLNTLSHIVRLSMDVVLRNVQPLLQNLEKKIYEPIH